MEQWLLILQHVVVHQMQQHQLTMTSRQLQQTQQLMMQQIQKRMDVEDAAEAADTTEEEGFSLLDVTADLVDAALYAVDDDNTEYVITLFRDPDGYSYVSLMIVPQDGQGDVLCGAYDDSNVTNVTDEDNIDWTEISTTDVYTGDDFSAVFVEADDGSVAIANSDFSLVMEGQYLTADEAIAYMGAAANYIN